MLSFFVQLIHGRWVSDSKQENQWVIRYSCTKHFKVKCTFNLELLLLRRTQIFKTLTKIPPNFLFEFGGHQNLLCTSNV